MFCQKCGAQLRGPFCTQCGAGVDRNQPPIQNAPAAQSRSSAGTNTSGSKILLVVAAVIGFLGLAFAGTMWYGWHKVKQAVAPKGIDLSTIAPSGAGRRVDACQLLTKEDLGQILNLTVERSEGTGPSTHSTCRYYSSVALKRGSDATAAAIQKIQETVDANSAPAQEERVVNELADLVRGIGGAAAGATNGEMLTIEVDSETAKAAMAGFRLGSGLSAAVVTGDAKPAADKFFYENVQGIGDEAAFGSLGSLLMFRKGDVSVKLDARTLPEERHAEIVIAKRILAEL